ncbi:TetR/AcrR family transcriptional regulator [Halothiobacillus neapolitanus]|uniref:Transcriptional regulator, TetR family n=1 Tax=Halothiobacillus neapolitanus (strain ATCC 23641 / DSM 15147 / CIP 104769 / NCIMB 8539 / c2) TaxID=555778 RepID=D0L160_HALNC|nr:TetR/AcrR family transcriptional regulator [Halothiobacillus neapolitanus]ACX96433.1 transcriptional regulator, TetR family [Halothiobacillus neapolitanus c2]TDN66748.1 TetR family transcriptional regulator [Halothiobacillus neapolitanus]
MKVDQSHQKRRGRPPKARDTLIETRELLLRAGLEVLTEKGFSTSGIDEILSRVGVPKGSFYHYFDNKEAFGSELIERYAQYFATKIERHLRNEMLSPLDRLKAFIEDASLSMERYAYRRGCLVGNLGQEAGVLPQRLRTQIKDVFSDWEVRLLRCLDEAKADGQISVSADTTQLASFFWIGWEGAVLRAKLERCGEPLRIFSQGFFAVLTPAT